MLSASAIFSPENVESEWNIFLLHQNTNLSKVENCHWTNKKGVRKLI